MRKKFKIWTVALCSAAISLNMAAPYLHAEISQDEIDYKGLPIKAVDKDDPTKPNYFPDEKFQQYLLDVVDKDKNEYLSDKEIENVKEINLNKDKSDNPTTAYAGIAKVDGIEVFKNLERFVCQDLASETGASSSLSLKFKDDRTDHTDKYSSVNAKLKYVNCNHSNVTGLDLKGCPEIEYVNCSDNYTLTNDNLDITENTKLEYLYCSNTGLTEPKLEKNTELKVLDCSFKRDDNRTDTGVFNPPNTMTTGSVTGLNLATNAKLEYLDCSGNGGLTTLTLPSDFGDAVYLKSNALKYIDCHECGLTSLDLAAGTLLQYLNCSGNDINPLNVSKNTKLEYLDCSGVVKENSSHNMEVTKTVNMPLILGKDSALRTLNCSNNTGIQASDLNSDESSIEYSTSLETLNCAGTKLTSLDLTKNTALETLICEEQLKQSDGTFVNGTDSTITDLKLNHLLYKKAGLSFNEIFGNITKRDNIKVDYDNDADGNPISTNVDIYYTDNALDIMNVVAKDVTENAKFKEIDDDGTTVKAERIVTYTNLNGDSAELTPPEKEGDYTLANCTHLYRDINRYSLINGEPIIIYANGSSKKVTITSDDGNGGTSTDVVKKDCGSLDVYTDIAASYKTNDTGTKSLTGKVVVGITDDSTQMPTITNNRIEGQSTLATAKIQNGKVTIKAKKNSTSGTGNVCYLWIIDTGSNGTYECCPINILVAPNKLAVRNMEDKDPKLNDATRMIGESIDVRIAGYVDGAQSIRTNDSTYEYSVPDAVKDCVEITQDGDHFNIKALKVNNNKDTTVNITFACGQNSKKIRFKFKISAAGSSATDTSSTTPGSN